MPPHPRDLDLSSSQGELLNREEGGLLIAADLTAADLRTGIPLDGLHHSEGDLHVTEAQGSL